MSSSNEVPGSEAAAFCPPMKEALQFMLAQQLETGPSHSPDARASLKSDSWFSSRSSAELLLSAEGSAELPGAPTVAAALVDEANQLQAEFTQRQRQIEQLQQDLAAVDAKLLLQKSDTESAVMDVAPACRMHDSLQHFAAEILDEADCSRFMHALNGEQEDSPRIEEHRPQAWGDSLEAMLGRVRMLARSAADRQNKLPAIADELQRQHAALDAHLRSLELGEAASRRSAFALARMSIEGPAT
eukprot:TRINITY_DN16466_c0_g1_i1.p1 TRINITY_DN16466_c0_g1~~TRINITY_DN16466_c0_g1_i1.p1  ORF type:complete len:244 (+),score=76.64 TRINITY_DN16466_c0_g1_i1:63-794(+)